MMTEAEALKIIQTYARRGWVRFDLGGHSRGRMVLRNVPEEDVFYGLIHAKSCASQANGRWKVDTEDTDGDTLWIVVAIEENIIVITVGG